MKHPRLKSASTLGDALIAWLDRRRLYWPLVAAMALALAVVILGGN